MDASWAKDVEVPRPIPSPADLSGGDSGESESSENISDGELEWLAKDLREVLALPDNKSARLDQR